MKCFKCGICECKEECEEKQRRYRRVTRDEIRELNRCVKMQCEQIAFIEKQERRYHEVTRDEIRRLREENNKLKEYVRMCMVVTNVGPEHHDVFFIGEPPNQIKCIAMKGIK